MLTNECHISYLPFCSFSHWRFLCLMTRIQRRRLILEWQTFIWYLWLMTNLSRVCLNWSVVTAARVEQWRCSWGGSTRTSHLEQPHAPQHRWVIRVRAMWGEVMLAIVDQGRCSWGGTTLTFAPLLLRCMIRDSVRKVSLCEWVTNAGSGF